MLTRFTVDEDGVQLAVVERLLKDRVVQSAKVKTVDLQHMMIELADEWMVFDTMLKGDPASFIERTLNYAAEMEGTNRQAKEILEAVTEYIVDNNQKKDIKQLYAALCKRLDVADLDIQSFNEVLHAMLSRMENVTEKSELLAMMTTLFEKAHLYDSPDLSYIQGILAVATKNVKEFRSKQELDELWQHLGSLMDPKILIEAAMPHLENFKFTTPVLPKNCLYFMEEKQFKYVCIEVDRQKIDVNINEDIIEQVGHPKLVFGFTINGNQVVNASVAAVKDEVITADTRLYRYPFSNVHNHMGMCWSGYPILNEFRNVESFPFLFLTGVRNFDLYPHTAGLEYRELLQQLAGKEFDDNLLVETEKTFATFMK